MEILDERELYGVLAHEVGHVKNYDMLVSTIAATLGGAISYLAQMAFFFGGNDEESPNPIAMIAMVILAPIAAMLIQMAVSRTREFGADQHGKKVASGKPAHAPLRQRGGRRDEIKARHQTTQGKPNASVRVLQREIHG